MVSAPCYRFLLFQYTIMVQVCKEKSDPDYVYGEFKISVIVRLYQI
ncbi:hypothetical protein MITSMUL_05162 [Mitsuokella multacida DSM 20544]|uniref:Uncharacterized protein n=1 Tax=Mitsuokella multacida DSM 20544 TaxID=500635 RepID=C9KPK6_9FIRM|nr:hypothetical protein MITSMUL_05162 [Mitsuokella multacida DSM 20544]